MTETTDRSEMGKQIASSSRRMLLLIASTLMLVALAITHGIRKGEFNINVDESQHAMTGFFFADLYKDRPWTHPVQYAYRYYAHYPALSGLIHWPPLFYVFAGLIFLLLGPSVVTARLTVLGFSLGGLYFWFKLISKLQNPWTAALSTCLLGLLPTILLFEKAVMLEIPCMALCIAASYHWIQFLENGKSRSLFWFAFVTGMALLTKQNAVYLAVFCLLTVAGMRKWRVMLNRMLPLALGLTILLVGPYYAVAYRVHWPTLAADLFANSAENQGWLRYAYYWQALPEQLGWPMIALSAVGIITFRLWDKREITLVMLSWIAASYLTFTLIGWKDPRYVNYWLPAFVYFASGPLGMNFQTVWARRIVRALGITLAAKFAVSAWMYQRPYVSGYEAAARRVTRMTHSGVIIFDGDLPANFIFYMRALDPARQFVILRKALYVMRIKKEAGTLELIHSPEELEQLLSGYGIRFIVVSQNAPLDFEVQRVFRRLLGTPQFKLVESFPIESNITEWQGRSLLLYENLKASEPTEKYLRIKMLTLNHDIVVPMSDLALR